MADLTSIEKLRLERFLEMPSGYVLDFTNRTFEEFILDNTRINIYSDKYSYASGSKANRLRAFWDKESNFLTGKLITGFLDYWHAQNELYNRLVSRDQVDDYHFCIRIAERLKKDGGIDHAEILNIESDDLNFNLLSRSLRETIEKNEPEIALDRLHTFVVKYIRQLCEKHKLIFAKEEALHSLFGKYTKHLAANNFFESIMAVRILKSSISILEAFNDVRNNRSLAHDNTILNYRESMLIFNSITNTIKFIESIEEAIDNKNKEVEKTSKVDELPF